MGLPNSGRCSEIGAGKLMHAQRQDIHLVTGCSSGFTRRSIGYVWRQRWLAGFDPPFSKMTWEFPQAEKGNIGVDRRDQSSRQRVEFTIAVACGGIYPSTAAKLLPIAGGAV